MPDNIRCNCGNPALRGKDVCLECLVKEFNVGQRKPKSHVEDDIQEVFFSWVGYELPKLDKLIFAVPNGGKRNVREAARFKKQGVKKGVSDIICLVPNGRHICLCLECKTDDGEQSAEQKDFQRQIENAGGKYEVFRSAQEGITILKNYLKTTPYV